MGLYHRVIVLLNSNGWARKESNGIVTKRAIMGLIVRHKGTKAYNGNKEACATRVSGQ